MVLHNHSGILTLTLISGFICTIEVNLWLLRHIVVNLKRTDLKVKLLWYRKAYIKTLLHILSSNKHMRNVFLIFLIVNLPINCYFLLRIKNSTDLVITIAVGFIFVEQVLVIFGIHWLIASLNAKFNKNIQFFISKFVPNSCFITKLSGVNLVANLKISLFIQTYQTTSKYGFTYGSIGLISLMTFTKVS